MVLRITLKQLKVAIALLVMGMFFFSHVPVAAAQSIGSPIGDATIRLDPTLTSNTCIGFDGRMRRLCLRFKVLRYLKARRDLNKSVEDVQRKKRAQELLVRAKALRALLEPMRQQREKERRTEYVFESLKKIPAEERHNILETYNALHAKAEHICRYKKPEREKLRCLVRHRNEVHKEVRMMIEDVIFRQ